jgi:hypothetical protein
MHSHEFRVGRISRNIEPSLTHQQHIDGVTILNPFQTTPQALGLAEHTAQKMAD